MAQTGGQQSDLFQRYKSAVGPDQNIPPLDNRQSQREILKDRQQRLLMMALQFNLAKPRDFDKKETIENFENYFIEHIHKIVTHPSVSDEQTLSGIGNKKMVVEYIGKAKINITKFLRISDTIKTSRDKSKLYANLHECIENFEKALKYWEGLYYNNVYPTKWTLSHCHQRIQEIYEHLSGSYYSIDEPSITDFERELREDILLTIITVPDSQARLHISGRETIINNLRQAKIYFNIALDELEISSGRTRNTSLGRLDKHLYICESCLRDVLRLWSGN